MKNKIKWVFLFLLGSCSMSFSQVQPTAGKVISDILSDIKTSAIHTDFVLSVTGIKGSENQTITGWFVLKNNKFRLETNEIKVWFDGKTQWSYNTDNHEVSITEPSEEQLAQTNPLFILSLLSKNCTIKYNSPTSSKELYNILMVPRKKTDILKFELKANRKTQNIVSIVVHNRNNTVYRLSLKTFRKGIDVSDGYFVYNPSLYKGAIINDLR